MFLPGFGEKCAKFFGFFNDIEWGGGRGLRFRVNSLRLVPGATIWFVGGRGVSYGYIKISKEESSNSKNFT